MVKVFACVVGARPNFMKMAPILRALRGYPEIRPVLIHTGQHYDPQLSDVFFQDLEMPRPDVHLNVGSGTHAQQTARIMEKMEEILVAGPPGGGRFDRVIVVGDVNSTMAAALAAVKLQIPVAHVEAGLRSFDRTMPEEINRLVTDSVSDMLFVSEPSGMENLRREGHPEDQIHLVGNVMIDTLRALLPRARALETLDRLGLTPEQYGVVTLHRPSNVDDPQTLAGLLRVLADIAGELPVVFPVHPRTRQRIEAFGLGHLLDGQRARQAALRVLPPLGYLEFLSLTSQARVIITDSGGLQEESTALGIPCLTVRPNTERPITVTEGTSTLVGSDPVKLRRCLEDVLSGRYKTGRCPELWDGKAAERIAGVLAAH
ncbi:non-hydrolyzing UDP-N-acetylglucosamine 2-epimerase [Thermogutta sp.]|uniref:non-hydrolyzing UDP-N-acetylglucosamine 2-epimerase n=1 Tax=Thermogutta sp. TaxID=1962930 RepID=UPI003C7DEBC1